MTHQLTLELPDEVYQPLLQKAKDKGQTVEAAAQECLTESVKLAGPGSRLRQFAGFWASGVSDAGVRHDEYLGQALYDDLNESAP
jgi:hypothetical protein